MYVASDYAIGAALGQRIITGNMWFTMRVRYLMRLNLITQQLKKNF